MASENGRIFVAGDFAPPEEEYADRALCAFARDPATGGHALQDVFYRHELEHGYVSFGGDANYEISPTHSQIEITPDGRFVILATNAVRIFARDSATGSLVLAQTYYGDDVRRYHNHGTLEDLQYVRVEFGESGYRQQIVGRFHVSPDGLNLYYTSEHYLKAYHIDPDTGALTQVQSIRFPPPGVTYPFESHLGVSGDGRFAYLMKRRPNVEEDQSIHIFDRDPVDGVLTEVQQFAYPTEPGGYSQIVSEDLAYWYLLHGPYVDTFVRDPELGTLSFTNRLNLQLLNHLQGEIAQAPNSNSYYVIEQIRFPRLHTLRRSPNLTLVDTKAGTPLWDDHASASNIEISPDSAEVVVTGLELAAVSVYSRNVTSGLLTQTQLLKADEPGLHLMHGPQACMTPDGAHVYVSTGPGAVFVFSRVDTTPPIARIMPVNVPFVTTGPIDIDIQYLWADEVTLTEEDIVLVTTGTVNALTTVSGSGTQSRTVTLHSINGDGTIQVQLPGSTAVDVAGNSALAPAPSDIILVDNSPPELVISEPSFPLTHHGPITYTVTYTGADAVTLSAADITLNATETASGVVSVTGAGDTRTVTIADISGNGTLGISIAAGTATDGIHAAAATGPSATFTVDENAPWVEIGAPSTALTNTGPISYTVTYHNVDTVTLSEGDVTLHSTGSASASVSIDAAKDATMARTVSLVSLTGDGTIAFSLPSGSASGALGDAPALGPTTPVEVDNTAPAITMLGYGATPVEQFQLYMDAGATAYDTRDGDLTTAIIVAGLPVDTSLEGSHTIRYNVSDAAGNPAPEARRTVQVYAAGALPVIAWPLLLLFLAAGFWAICRRSSGTT
jgi:6-phosphogluconolactonase (cycloisomerase 2 family)